MAIELPSPQDQIPVETPVELPQTPLPRPIPEEAMRVRAKKFSEGLSELLGRTEESILNDLSSGREDSVRQEATARLNEREILRRQEVIGTIAKTRGSSVKPEELRMIMMNATPFDPETAPEKEYAKYYMQILDKPDTFMSDAYTASKESADVIDKYREAGTDYMAKREILQTKAEEMASAAKDQSWFGWGIDQLKSLIPLYNEAKQRGNVPDVGYLTGGLLQGNNLEEQQKALFRLPAADFTRVLNQTLNMYKKDNPALGVAWVSAMLGQSSSEAGFNNVMTAMEPAMFPAAGLKALNPLKMFTRKAVGDVVQSSATKLPTKAAAHEAVGDIEAAAIERSGNQLVDSVLNQRVNARDTAFEALPTGLRSDLSKFVENPGRMSEDWLTRMQARYEATIDAFTTAVKDKLNVMRTPDLLNATKEQLAELSEGIKGYYPGINNAILDVSKPIYNGTTNTFSVDILIGKSGNELFRSFTEAKQWARANGIEQAVAQQRGGKWFLKISQPLKETDGFVRDLIKQTTITDVPESLMNAFFGWLRNPDETLSIHQRLERKNATYGASNLLKIAKEEAVTIQKLSKSQRSDLVRIMDGSRRVIDPADGLPGYTYKNVPELDFAYMRTLNRLPEDNEVEAYFSYFRIHELDRQYRNLLTNRNMLRAGVEQHEVLVKAANGDAVSTGFFNGTKLQRLPASDDTVVVFGKGVDDYKIYRAKDLVETAKFKKTWTKLKEDIDSGKKVVLQIWDTEARPLSEFGNLKETKVRYVVADKTNSKNIEFDQIGRRGGPHNEYDYPLYVKQAKIHKERYGDKNAIRYDYEGDATAFGVTVRALGKEAVEIFNKTRMLIKAGDEAGAKAFFNSKAIMGLDYKEFRSWFKGKKVDGKIVPARFNKDEPFQLIERDQKIVDVDNSLKDRYHYVTSSGERISLFRDATKTGNPARELQVQFTGQRDAYDLMAFRNEGSVYNPVYKYEPAKYVDPLTTLDRAYSKATNSLWMDDYKITSVEHWLEQAKPWLKADENQLRASPFHWFHVGPSEFKPGAPKEVVENLKTAHWQIQQFLGVRSDTDALIHRSAVNLADSLYNKFGEKGLVIDPLWLMPKLKDPFKFMRSAAFHAKLGMFAIPQLLIQAQTHSVMMGMGGLRNTLISMGASMMTELSRLNSSPGIVKHLDTLMTKLRLPGAGRWKAGEFAESLEALQRSGFMNVGQEYALRDSLENPTIVTTRMGRFLDAGTVFFTEGERFSRISAWHLAYREFRDANPTARLTQESIKKILGRADDLTVNMSRASSSSLHTGILALPTQFLSYQIRLAELMWGKRLSTMERAKILAYQSMLYGVPTAIGVTGLPLGDVLRKAALENGYVVGDNWVDSLVTEGLPATMIALLTGEGDIKKGTWLNIGDRFGSQGFETIREAFRGDKTMWDILGGAGFSVAKGFWDGSDGFREMVLSGLREDGQKIKFTPEDILDIFKEISSVNNTWKLIAALNTGKWLSKKEAYLGDVSRSQAWVQFLTGLQEQGVTDLQLMSWSQKDKANMEKYVEQQFMQEFRRGLRVQSEYPEEANKYFSRAFHWLAVGDYPTQKRTGLIARASKDYESLIESMNWSFYMNNVAPSQIDTRFKAYQKTREIQNLRGNN